jgi:hypothetical protein
MTLSEQAMFVALSQLGVTEHPLGSNAGPEVEAYLKSVGLGKGYSWCAAFVYWCFNEASIKLQRPNPVPRTGGVLKMYHQASPATRVLIGPKINDVFVMDYGKGLGHTGFVTGTTKTHIYTCEGNSDAAGSRTGGMVCENIRPKSDPRIRGYLRFG